MLSESIKSHSMAAGSWTQLEELFTAEAAEFLTEIRRVHHGERLGDFAAKWFADSRPVARQFLFDYLDQPLNCYRHEALVKRLFKIAEKANDDELMGALLVAFDRSIRRQRRSVHRSKYESFDSRDAAIAAQARWLQEGYSEGTINQYGQRFQAYATKTGEEVQTPFNTTMPRPGKAYLKRDSQLDEKLHEKYAKRYTLFSVVTRRYLQRRAWRYFRNVGKTDPQRYLRTASQFLMRYRDADIGSDIHLLDNWGLMNALFHGCTALEFKRTGCNFADGKSMADLTAAPRFESTAWTTHPHALFSLMIQAPCRAVRRWSFEMLRRFPDWFATQPVTRLLALIDSPDDDVAAYGYELLAKANDLGTVPVEQWLRRLDGDDLGKLTRLSEFLQKHLDPERVSPETAIQLAMYRSKPVAEIGFSIVKSKPWNDPSLLVGMAANAECDAVRTMILAWLTEQRIGTTIVAPAEWLMEWFDSRHEDVREQAWDWFQTTPPQDEASVWPKLMESPYDAMRFRMVSYLEKLKGIEPASTRGLWATVLTNIHRGGRQKPGVVKQIVERLTSHPAEAESLLPLLAIAVRSLRGPEFRAGLAGLVQIATTNPELQSRVQQQFPEFTLGG
ncbi:hypothetical protein BH11PLA2_BH11PLA2_37430 [soil metagenome]